MAVKTAVRKTSKATKAQKPMAPKAAKKTRKPKRVTKKSQTGTMRMVWNGSKVYTKSGFTKKMLCVNKHGRVMTKKQFKHGQKLGKSKWNKAFVKARKELGITGFVRLNRGIEGKELYKL